MNKANPDNAHNTFVKLYKDAYNTAFPKAKICVNKRHIKQEPWMTFSLLKSSLKNQNYSGRN